MAPGHDASTVSPRRVPATTIRAVLLALYRAYEALGLYAPQHPATTAAASEGAATCNDALRLQSPLTIIVGRQKIESSGVELHVDPPLAPLAILFDESDLAAIDVVSALSPQQFLALAGALRDGVRGRLRGGELAEKTRAATNGHAWCRPFNFAALSARTTAASVARRSPDRQQRDDQWHERLRRLAIQDSLDDHEMNQLASEAGRHDASADQGPSLRLDHLASVLRYTPEPHRDQATRRLQTLVHNMDGKLRSSLLNVQPLRDAGDAAMMGDAAPVLPPDELLNALEQSSRDGAGPTGATVLLFNKLLRLFEDNPQRVQRLAGIYSKLDDGAAQAAQNAATCAETLRELLSRRLDEEWNPEDYGANLTRLSQTTGAAPQAPRLEAQWTSTAAHAANLAVELLGEAASRHDEGPWRFVTNAIGDLIDTGRFDLIAEAVRDASAVGHGADECVVEAVGAFMEELRRPANVERFIHHADAESVVAPDFRFVLSRMGPDAIAALLRRAGELPAEAAATLLRELFIAHETLMQSALAKCADDPATLLRLARFEGAINDVQRLRILQPLLECAETDARRDAYRALNDLQLHWPATTLRQGVGDDDSEIQRLSLLRLEVQQDGAAVELVGAIAAEHTGRRFADYLFDMACAVLGQCGDAGCAQLAGAFRKLLRKPTRQHARRALRMMPILQEHARTKSVRRALAPHRRILLQLWRTMYRLPMETPS